MPIKKKNINMGIIKGDVPLKSVMIGAKCVYGFDFAEFKITYPPVTTGTGLYIVVNETRVVIEPKTAGELEVHYGDSIQIRTYAEAGYKNPKSSVVACGNLINGVDHAVEIDGIEIKRATTYEFVVNGDSTITLDEAVPAPTVNLSVVKDDGIECVNITYIKGAYECSGLNDVSIDPTIYTLSSTNDTFQLYLYSEIVQEEPYSVANEGYKVISTTKNYTGILTTDNQCTITAVSQAGKRVSIVCPPVPNGVTEYALYMVSSEYSKALTSSIFYNQKSSLTSQASVEISQRNDDLYYFYIGDTIKITAVRKDGYKLPSLGKQGEIISHFVTAKQIILSDENVLLIESGEQGIPVRLVNDPLQTTEYVYLRVTSDYTNYSVTKRNPQVYVEDIITVPLSPNYRIGTSVYRKPGVGFSGDGSILTAVTFTDDATVQVPNVSELIVNLQQGAKRVSTSQYSLSPVATFSRLTNISPMEISYRSISGSTLTPVSGYGPEEYFLSTFDLKYSCKRYWLDAITSKYNKISQYNVPENFSYEYDCDVFPTKVVIAGTYTINSDRKRVTLTVSNYDTDWVASSSDQAKLIPRMITV